MSTSPSLDPAIVILTNAQETKHILEDAVDHDASKENSTSPPLYTLYKRRYIGLIHLALLNLVVSWSWLTFAASSTTTAQYFHTSDSDVNWLSTGFLFAFVVATPATLWALNRGPKLSMSIAGCLLIAGSWIRYGASRVRPHGSFGLLVVGQILIGFAQPFVLIAPTRYSHLWFSDRGRVTATALASLANPFGGAIGQLVGPFILTSSEKTPELVLYVAIITTIISLITFFLPTAPPSPPSSTSTIQSDPLTLSIIISTLCNPTYHLLAWPFIIYVAAFNSTSTLLNQILEPYGYTEDQAGIDGAIMIAVGLVAAAISSPLIDRYPRSRLFVIKLCVLLIASMYLALIFVPATGSLAPPYIISAIIGAASFVTLPLALESMVDACLPIGPEVSSTMAWATSQLVGGVFIVIMDALKAGSAASPPANLRSGLVFQAVLVWVVLPLPMFLGSQRMTIMYG